MSNINKNYLFLYLIRLSLIELNLCTGSKTYMVIVYRLNIMSVEIRRWKREGNDPKLL